MGTNRDHQSELTDVLQDGVVCIENIACFIASIRDSGFTPEVSAHDDTMYNVLRIILAVSQSFDVIVTSDMIHELTALGDTYMDAAFGGSNLPR